MSRRSTTGEAGVLMIFQDGHAFVNPDGDYRMPHVFDNLIHRREMPVTIAVFINPGRTPEQPEATSNEWGDRTNNRRERIQRARRQVREASSSTSCCRY